MPRFQRQTLPPSLHDALRRYLNASLPDWEILNDDSGFPIEAVYIVLQAQEHRRPSYGEGEPRRPLAPEAFGPEAAEGPRGVPFRGRDERPPAEAPRPQPPPPPVELAQALQEARHLVILGEPGAGKTTTLQYLALQFGRAALAALDGHPARPLGLEEIRIPVRVRLDTEWPIDSNPLPDLWSVLPTDILSLEDWKTLRDAGLLLVLLDGLDEVPEARREALRRRIEDARYANHAGRTVVSTRPAGYLPLKGFQDYRLLPLDEARTPDLFRRWVVVQVLLRNPGLDEDAAQKQAEAAWQILKANPALRSLTRTPLTLKMLAEEAAQNPQALRGIRNLAGLYDRYITGAMQERARARGLSDPNAYRRALQRLEIWAWHRHTRGVEDEDEEGALRRVLTRPPDRAPCPADAEVLLPAGDETAWAAARRDLAATGLVQPYRRADGRALWPFTHRTWQEYLVARRLKQAWQSDPKTTWRFLAPRLHLPAWRELLRLFVGLLPEPQAHKLIRRIAQNNDDYEPYLHRHARLALELSVPLAWPEPALQALRDKNAEVRCAVARALGAMGEAVARHPLVLPALLQALQDEDADARETAAAALGAIGQAAARHPDILPTLLRALRDEDAGVRRAAAWALGEIGEDAIRHPGVLSALLRALLDKNEGVNRMAAWALREMGESVARHPVVAQQWLQVLLRALQDEDAKVRYAAAWALERMGEVAAPHPQVLPALLRALQDEVWRVREAAARALGAMGEAVARHPEVLPALLRALQDEDGWVRTAAGGALGRMGEAVARHPQVLPALLRALQDEDADVRWAAAKALGAMGEAAARHPQVLPALLRTLRDEHADVRYAAIGALVRMGETVARHSEVAQQWLPALLRALQDENRWVHGAACRALGHLGEVAARHPQVLPALFRALQDKDADVREAAAWALGRMDEVAARHPQVLPALLRALRDEDAWVRRAAARALGGMGEAAARHPGVLPALLRALQDEKAGVRETATTALEALLPLAEEDAARAQPLQDPLCPPPPPRWRQVVQTGLINLGVGAAVLAALGLAALATILLPAVQEALRPHLQAGLQGLSPLTLLALAVGLPLLASGLGKLARHLWFRRPRPGRSAKHPPRAAS